MKKISGFLKIVVQNFDSTVFLGYDIRKVLVEVIENLIFLSGTAIRNPRISRFLAIFQLTRRSSKNVQDSLKISIFFKIKIHS